MDFRQDTFMEWNYRHARTKQKKFSDVSSHREHIRQGLHATLGDFTDTQKEREDLQPVLLERTKQSGYVRERIAFQAAKDSWIPVYILTPKNDAHEHPAVIALHGHGSGSRQLIGIDTGKEEGNQTDESSRRFALQLVKRGLKVFVPEIAGFGERMLSRDIEEKKACSCESMAKNLLMTGRTLAGLRVFETKRMLDLIEFYPDVKKESIGIMGFSGGGMVAAYTAVLDQRIRATVLSGFANTYRGSIMAMHHCIDNYVPGILNYGELPDILELIAPRPLFIEAGRRDPIFPLPHTRKAIEQLEPIYANLQKEQNFSHHLFQGGHEINGQKSFDWLAASLQKETDQQERERKEEK